jgi:DNA-binding PadR family transcriptional regulator
MAASTIPGKGLHLALLLLSLCAGRPYPSVKLTRRMLEQGNLSRDASYDGLRRLQAQRLVTVRRLPGRSPQIVLL